MSRLNWVDNWPAGARPRSMAYRRGFQAGHDWMAYQEPRPVNPFPAGTPESDAWLSGCASGRDLVVADMPPSLSVGMY